MIFFSHAWHHVLGFQVVVYKELFIDFLSTVRFIRESRIWSDDLAFSFRLGKVLRSGSLVELGQRFRIYLAEDADHPFLESYLDSCILSE